MENAGTISGSKEYRIVLLDSRSGGTLAVSDANNVLSLIRITVSSCARIAPQLHARLRREWGLKGTILDIFPGQGEQGPWAVVRVFPETVPDMIAGCLQVTSIDMIPDKDLSPSERSMVSQIQQGTTSNPFSRPGWLEEAIEWVETSTQCSVATRSEISQYNAGGKFTLIRFVMKDGSVYWLKATGRANAHELRISCLLSRLCHDCVPEIVAIHPLWNA